MSDFSYSDLQGGHGLGSFFKSLSKKLYPDNLSSMFDWAAEFWMHQGLYTQTVSKAVRYFMTELVFDTDDGDVEKSYEDYFAKHPEVMEEAAKCGDETIGFGNSFTSVYIPILRRLQCPKCNAVRPYSKIADRVSFDSSTLEFKGECGNCKKSVAYVRNDLRKSGEDAEPRVLRWDPKIIKIAYNGFTGRSKISMDPSKDTTMTTGIRRGDSFYLEDTPWEVIEAVCKNKPVVFNQDNIFHMKEEPPAFLKSYFRGWGMPRFMSDFQTMILILMLDRYNEVILSDYLVPMRVISPSRQTGIGGSPHLSGDLMGQVDFRDIKAPIDNMIAAHRDNPTTIHSAPIHLNYQVMGGEASSLAAVELIEHYEQRFLLNTGFPIEIIRKSMQGSAAPLIGFKLYERTWQHFANGLNAWFTWYGKIVATLKGWDETGIKAMPSSIYEDPQIKGMKLDLAGAGQISMTTALKSIGLSYQDELHKKIAEQELENDYYESAQRNMEKRQANMEALRTTPAGAELLMREQAQQEQAQGQGGQAPPPPLMGGMPGGGTTDNASLDQLNAEAEQMAEELFAMDATMRRSTLINLSKNNDTLHALVKSKLESLEQQVQTQGLSQARAQASQAG